MLGTSGSSGERSEPVTATRAHLAALDLRDGRRAVGDREQRLPLDDAEEHLVAALVRDHLPGMPLLSLSSSVAIDEGRRGRGVVRLVGMRFRVFDQLLDVLAGLSAATTRISGKFAIIVSGMKLLVG